MMLSPCLCASVRENFVWVVGEAHYRKPQMNTDDLQPLHQTRITEKPRGSSCPSFLSRKYSNPQKDFRLKCGTGALAGHFALTGEGAGPTQS